MTSSDLGHILASLASNKGTTMGDGIVTAIGADGTVNLNMLGQLVDGVPCLRNYTGRKVGDVVLVLVSGKRLVVAGAIGDESDGSGLDIPPETVVQWGAGAPGGSGWVISTDGVTYVKKNQIYIVTGSSPPAAPSNPSPSPITVPVTAWAAFRNGYRDHDDKYPSQGAWPTYPYPYTGAWYYDGDIAAACAGKTVASMTVTLVRKKRPTGGIFGGAPARLYLHGANLPSNVPPSIWSPWTPGTLEPGQQLKATLPSSWVSALKSGSAKGIACKAGVGSEYINYAACGAMYIKFSA